MGQISDLPIPRTRSGHQTQLFERYHRRREEVDSAMVEMFVKGVSTQKVGSSALSVLLILQPVFVESREEEF